MRPLRYRSVGCITQGYSEATLWVVIIGFGAVALGFLVFWSQAQLLSENDPKPKGFY